MNADPDALGIVFVLVIYGFAFLIGIGISALISYFLYRTAVVIPENQRLVSPGAAFLLICTLGKRLNADIGLCGQGQELLESLSDFLFFGAALQIG